MNYIRDYGCFESLLGNFIWGLYREEIRSVIQRECQRRNLDVLVNIYALDAHGFSDKMETKIVEDKCLKVFFIIDLTKSNAPYLKYADFIIFLSPDQSRFYDLLYQYTKPSFILKLNSNPLGKVASKKELCSSSSDQWDDRKGLAFLLGWHYKPYEYSKLAKKIADTVAFYYRDVELDRLNIVCQVPLIKSKKLVEYVEKLIKKPVLISDINHSENAKSVLRLTRYVEILTQGDFEDPFRILNNPEMRFEIRSVDYNVSSNAWELIAKNMGCESLSHFNLDYVPRPYYEKNELGYKHVENEDPHVEALNIVYGEPLNNRYVLSVLFRNVGEKLIRCVNSILSVRHDHDVGVVLVDDCSNDNAVETAAQILMKEGVSVCVVRNLERRYASHNYYLVINRLVTNDQSVIIDLDGDDQLNVNYDVFGELDKAYSDGKTLKTFGSFTTMADDAGEQIGGTSKEIFKKIFQGYQLLNDASSPFNQFRFQSWLHLRTAKRGLLKKVDVAYFKARSTKDWLKTDHDTSVNSRAVEIAGSAAVKFIEKPLYVYDITGPNHDFMEKRGADVHDILLDLHRAYSFDNIDRKAID